MKKQYAIAMAFAITGTAFAQSGARNAKLVNRACDPQLTGTVQQVPHSAIEDGNGARSAFYSEDFSGGFPAGWTSVDDLTPSGETAVNFVWSDDPGAVTAASANQPLILTFLAPGASNGYLWANSDRGLSSAPPSIALTRLTTTSIDCSGQSTVLLTMKSTIGVFDLDADTACKVRVSTDGVNWTDFAPFPCLVTGNINPPCERFSYNPQSVAINISSVAANQSNVVLQFQWRGGWEYYWAIDDLELSPIPDHEIKMDYGFASQFSGGFEYGRVPVNQMQSTLNVGAEVVNFGAMDQTNVAVNVSLQDASGTEIGSAVTNIGTILNGDTVVTDEYITLPDPLQVGLYTTVFTVTSDQIALDDDPGNNTKERSFEVTSDLYSLDGIGVYPDASLSLTSAGTGSFADNAVNVSFLAYYKVNAQTTFYGAQMELGSQSEAGSLISFAVFDSTALGATLGDPLNVTEDHVVSDAEISAGEVTLQFLDPITLSPGGYYVSAKLSQQDEKDLYVLDDITVPEPLNASYLFTPVDPDGIFLYNGNGNAWAIRLSANPSVPVTEHAGSEGVTIYPNPTTGVLHINTAKAGPITVEVRNVLGAIVKTATFDGTVNTLDLSGNAAGLYSVRIGNGTNFTVERVTLK